MTSRVYVDLEAERKASAERHTLRELGKLPRLERCYFDDRLVVRLKRNQHPMRRGGKTIG